MELERVRPQFEQAGARIVAISTDNPQTARRTQEELGLGFTLIPDHQHTLLKLYDHRERYSQQALHNPAVYIVDHNGVVRWRYFGASSADRPDPAQIWQALRQVLAQG